MFMYQTKHKTVTFNKNARNILISSHFVVHSPKIFDGKTGS